MFIDAFKKNNGQGRISLQKIIWTIFFGLKNKQTNLEVIKNGS